ncbi:hypothetical protein IPG41_05890 [Candidatus Peregrinibacteria bacterium]|nr:MAG: hypothetical protein IPG41_05890 [Candidatus Peregrinibacteria bacterium]
MATIDQACRECKNSFSIEEVDQAFYTKMEVPLPTLCPEDRQRRRMLWRNERSLYHGKCELCGKQIITMYRPGSPYKVYCNPCWWGDRWSGLDSGRSFDFNRPFFEQFKELLYATPHPSLCNDASSTNSDYVNQTSYMKDSYLVFDSDCSESVYYSHLSKYSKSSMDCLRIYECELCYECVDCEKCYQLFNSQDCQNCTDSAFLRDCRNCNHCFGSVGLRNKEYYFFNKPLSKEAYEATIAAFNLDTHGNREKLKAEVRQWFLNFSFKADHNMNNENSTGDYLKNTKDCSFAFDCQDVRDCHFCSNLSNGATDCYDYDVWGFKAELIYDSITVGDRARKVLFSNTCWGVDELMYCDNCMFSSNLFGCVGLKKNTYCILNKQYSKEEYEVLVPRIIEHMQKTGEWGEFFPSTMSAFAYNETVASIYYPLSPQEAQSMGYSWKEDDESSNYKGPDVQVPAKISDVNDAILKQILRCKKTDKLYRVIPQELAFYRQMQLPVPLLCPEERHVQRMSQRNPRKLWPRHCDACQTSIQSTYAPNRPEKVLCEACYLKTVY